MHSISTCINGCFSVSPSDSRLRWLKPPCSRRVSAAAADVHPIRGRWSRVAFEKRCGPSDAVQPQPAASACQTNSLPSKQPAKLAFKTQRWCWDFQNKSCLVLVPSTLLSLNNPTCISAHISDLVRKHFIYFD